MQGELHLQTTKSILDGGVFLTLTNLDEEYYITFPTYYGAYAYLIMCARNVINPSSVCSSQLANRLLAHGGELFKLHIQRFMFHSAFVITGWRQGVHHMR
jgi:hypothetical protein